MQPLLLVFEDLHWIDSETQTFLDSLADSVPTARLMLLVNYRPEYQHAWGYTPIRIDPLPPASAGELLQALLGSAAQVELLTELLIARTEGSPFFLEESVRTLIAQLGEGYLLVGRIDDAITASERAVDFALKHKERANQAWAVRLLGEIVSRRGPHCMGDAQHHYGQALALAIELGMRPLIAHCHLGLGKLYHQTSKGEQAQEHLTTATTMYREMDMTYWLEKAEAEMRS